MGEGCTAKNIYLRSGLLFFLFIISVAASSFVIAIEGIENPQCKLPKNGRIDGVVELNANCTYFGSIVITESNTSLNCMGSTLDGESERRYGILITGKGREIKNVSVKNCNVENFTGVGVMVASGIKFERDGSRDKYYINAPKEITLSNLKVDNNLRGGVTFNAYVTDSVLQDSVVTNTNAAGVYLSQSSRGISIKNNIIQKNGWRSKPGGWREGLAIDSSAGNKIINNRFIENAAGGIFLYKNCGENYSKGRSVIRWQPSSDNIIEDNVFKSEKIGVWVASRQSKDLSKSDCGDPSVDKQGRYYKDYSDRNLIRGNYFCGVKVAVRIEGNNNQMQYNIIDKATKNWIVEPFKSKPKPDGELTFGNQDISNKFQECNI